MKTIRLSLRKKSYNIVIGNDILPKLGTRLKKMKIGADAVIITNKNINRLHGKKLRNGLKQNGISSLVIEVPDSERSKSSAVAIHVLEKIARYDIKKRIFIVAFGGGVVGDLAGFIAAVYKRGIPYVQVPTTLLAQIDSAIGGKTAIDLPTAKNLAGAFYQPKIVWSDVAVLATLPKRELKNGLSEAVKYGAIKDARLFSYIEHNHKKLLSANHTALTRVISTCSKIKATVVGCDEKETRGIRTILNFGHTIGHAVEAAGGYERYSHGEAVALGMRVAAHISEQLGLCSNAQRVRLEDTLDVVELPKWIRHVRVQQILSIIAHDKKFKAAKNRFVLLVRIGKVRVVEGIPPVVIAKAVKAYLK